MPSTEPNAVPEVFVDRPEWRTAYACYVEEYRDSVKAHPASETTYAIRLRNRLTRLGFAGHALENEMAHVKAGGN